MPKHEPKPCVDAEGKPKFDTKTFLSETVRMGDWATRDLMNLAHAGKGSPKAIGEIADQYRHIANRVQQVADMQALKLEEARKAVINASDTQ